MAVLNYVWEESGELCVTIIGIIMMHLWLVISWDSQDTVSCKIIAMGSHTC